MSKKKKGNLEKLREEFKGILDKIAEINEYACALIASDYLDDILLGLLKLYGKQIKPLMDSNLFSKEYIIDYLFKRREELITLLFNRKGMNVYEFLIIDEILTLIKNIKFKNGIKQAFKTL